MPRKREREDKNMFGVLFNGVWKRVSTRIIAEWFFSPLFGVSKAVPSTGFTLWVYLPRAEAGEGNSTNVYPRP